jgi:hypothetical protein
MTELQAVERGLRARNRLILIHALIGLEVGLFIMLTGGPQIVEEAWGPWVRYYLGAQALIPGALTLVALLVGLGARSGRIVALIGLLGLLMWQLTMAAIFAVSALRDGVILEIGEHMPMDAALSYVSWVYINLAALMIVHLVEIVYSTFWRDSAARTIHLGPPDR